MASSFSTGRRALAALPFLGLSVLIGVAFSSSGSMLPDALAPTIEAGFFSANGAEARLLPAVYGIGLLDSALGPITAAFSYLNLYPADPPTWWLSLVFLSEFAGIYAVLLLEASRPAYKWSVWAFPFIVVFIGQFVCVGFISPIWFYLHYVFNTPNKFSSTASRAISPAHAVAVLPSVAVAYLIPHFLCYFHPDFDARHWWNWIWQIYPVWGAIVFAVVSTALAPFAASVSSRSIVRATVGVLAVIGTGSYWYALSAAEFSVAELLVPGFFTETPGEAAVALRTIIQYDYMCCFLATMLWVGYGIGDLKTANAIDVSWAVVLLVAAVSWAALGTGTTLLIGWAWRNEVLESGALDRATSKKKTK